MLSFRGEGIDLDRRGCVEGVGCGREDEGSQREALVGERFRQAYIGDSLIHIAFHFVEHRDADYQDPD